MQAWAASLGPAQVVCTDKKEIKITLNYYFLKFILEW